MAFWLVVSNMVLFFHFIYGMSSFPLTFIFFKMGKTTNQLLCFICSIIYGNVIIPTDDVIFFRGVGIPPTSINSSYSDGKKEKHV